MKLEIISRKYDLDPPTDQIFTPKINEWKHTSKPFILKQAAKDIQSPSPLPLRTTQKLRGIKIDRAEGNFTGTRFCGADFEQENHDTEKMSHIRN